MDTVWEEGLFREKNTKFTKSKLRTKWMLFSIRKEIAQIINFRKADKYYKSYEIQKTMRFILIDWRISSTILFFPTYLAINSDHL